MNRLFLICHDVMSPSQLQVCLRTGEKKLPTEKKKLDNDCDTVHVQAHNHKDKKIDVVVVTGVIPLSRL